MSISDSDNQIVTNIANELSEFIFGKSLNFSPDGWDVAGGTANIAETLAGAIHGMTQSWADAAGYQSRMRNLAQQAISRANIEAAKLSSGATMQGEAIRKAAQVAAENMRKMGDLVASGVPAAGLTSAENTARILNFAKSFALVAGGIVSLGQVGAKIYDATQAQATTHDVMGTTINAVVTTLAGLGAGFLLAPLVTSALGAIVVGAAAISFGYVTGKIVQAAYDHWGKGVTDFLNQFGEFLGGKAFDAVSAISEFLLSTADPLVKIIKYVMVDPLVLDLDGDGLEITPLSQGVQFDGNGDTIRTNTSWIDADDGLLVLDRNGNGAIDSGRELFGDETLLADGKKAAHGFAALAELDVGGAANATGGAGDGVFDAKDAQYTNVRIWRDLNQDGISQASEMQTLAQAGIASVKLTSIKTDTNYGDAQLVQSGSFTRTDGSEGEAGSFILAQNNAVTTHAPIAISAEAAAVLIAMRTAAAALPANQGKGWVATTIMPRQVRCYRQRGCRGHAGEQGHRVCSAGAGRGHQAGDVSLHPLRHGEGQRGQGDAGRGE